MAQIGADGVNFDTLEDVPAAFHAAAEAAHHPLALEPQFAIRDESLAWSTISWNDWVTWEDTPYPFVPMVNQAKWLERRHTINVTDRFTRDKTNSLQHAFFNGIGYVSAENLWGFWYGTTPHDAEAVLRFTRIERAFGANAAKPGLGAVHGDPAVRHFREQVHRRKRNPMDDGQSQRIRRLG